MHIILFALGILFLLLFPKLFLFLYLAVRYISNVSKYKNIVFFDFVVFLYCSLSLAFMIANRPYYLGKEIGFGEDMFHYYNAFYWVIDNDFSIFIKDFGMITNLTGSAEPVFWLIVKIFSFFTNSEYTIHILLTLLGCYFIFLAGQIWSKSGLLFLFFYTNTITFFAFQGSAIRSGLAFCFILFALVLFLKNINKYLIYLSPTIHFSMIPLPLIIYFSSLDFKNPKNYYKLGFVVTLMLLIIFYFSMKSLDGGLGSKLTSKLADENTIDYVSVIQFLIENMITFLIVFLFSKRIVSKEIKVGLIVLFFVCLLMLFVSPSSFSRFYRYEYIYFILIYSSIFMKSSKWVRLVILTLSMLWFVFLGFDRFIGVFAENIFDYLAFNVLYRFN